MFERLEVIRQRNEFITNELTKPEVISDVAKTTELSKEQADLSEIIECYNEYLKAKTIILFHSNKDKTVNVISNLANTGVSAMCLSTGESYNLN